MAQSDFDFVPFLQWDEDELLVRLAKVCSIIAQLSELLAEAKSRELDDKARAWKSSGETTVRGRERSTDYSAIIATRTVKETEGQLASLRTEKEFITFLLTIRMKVSISA